MEDKVLITDIRIDKDGVWYYRGMEMIRKDIVQHLYRHIKLNQDGRYLIEIGEDRAYLDVEDTPYVIKSVTFAVKTDKGEDIITLQMPDDSFDVLDPSTLRVGADNTLYGMARGLGFEARFSRASYYELAKHIEYEAGTDKFYICLNNHHYYIEKTEARPETA